jgi:tetratricopeptide (TPR) repeat protein
VSYGGSWGRGALAFAAIVGVVACALPLTGTFGPESALLLSLTLTPWVGGLSARAAQRARGKATGLLLPEVIGRGLALLAVPLLVIALNGLRTEPCDPFGGLRFIALGPAIAIVLVALLGAALGSALPAARWAIALAALLPLFEALRAAERFVNSPAIFAFGHLFGYFPGTFYDRKIDIPDAWLTHRLLSASIALGAWALLTAARDPESGRFARSRLQRHPLLVVGASALAIVSLTMVRNAHALQHASSSDSISERLGLVIDAPRCRAVLPRELRIGEAQRLAEDCEFRIAQIEHLLGVQERSRITAFFFRSPNEKRQLMGAARVYIAKPWRREVYLQLAEFPHPVLAHELAHVVARHASRGPFGVPGRLGGLLPEPTLVEGMAVALEPHARDELTPHQWARAAQSEKLAPPLSALLGVSFFGTNQALAYTLAGSFLRFVLETRGADTLRRVYASGSVERVLKKPLASLEREWRAHLAQVPLPERAAALARLRFERPSVLSQVCPHVVEGLEGELGAALNGGDLPRAIDKCREVLAIDPRDSGTRATLAAVLAHKGQEQLALAELAKLAAAPRAPSPTLSRVRTALADASFAGGDYERAAAGYRALLEQPQPEADLRQLEVKLLALAAGEPARSLLRELMTGEPFRGAEPRTAMHLIGELAPLRQDGLALYLEARQLTSAGRHDFAQALLREALVRGLPTPRLRTEALRMHAHACFITGQLGEADALASELERREGGSLAEQLEARDLRARIAFRRANSAR